MLFDPNQITPCGLTYAEIDAKQAAYVRAANEALALLQDCTCRWWLYSAAHDTFELLIGAPQSDDNLVISLTACHHIAGPVTWPNQRLRIIWHNDRQADKGWEFVVEDEEAGFRAVGGVFGWRRGYNLLEQRSLYCKPLWTMGSRCHSHVGPENGEPGL